jgi:hypothetical protein
MYIFLFMVALVAAGSALIGGYIYLARERQM